MNGYRATGKVTNAVSANGSRNNDNIKIVLLVAKFRVVNRFNNNRVTVNKRKNMELAISVILNFLFKLKVS